MADANRIGELIFKYLRKDITADELAELEAFTHSSGANLDRFERRISDKSLLEGIALWQEATLRKQAGMAHFGWDGESAGQTAVPLKRLPRIRYWMIAASVLLLLGAGAFLWNRHPQTTVQGSMVALPAQDHAPGGNHATLLLDNGKTLELDSLHNGTLAEQSASTVKKLADGQLAYETTGSTAHISYNTLTTPSGGQYQLTLADGTKVWLNNASSLRYPASFTGSERTVELTGEAYFEVTRDVTHPFIVRENRLQVKVLGTHFNIQAYKEDGTEKTTLLEGTVRIERGDEKALLAPGDQAAFAGGRPLKLLHDVDVDQVISWKNGYFHFESDDLPSVMMQLARWYDVMVEYRGTLEPQHISGKIQRNLPLSKVLKNLESPRRHFTIEGNKIIVSP
jgi:ferric-dicitrate binding protein FerR (iron transport regulator)